MYKCFNKKIKTIKFLICYFLKTMAILLGFLFFKILMINKLILQTSWFFNIFGNIAWYLYFAFRL